MKKQLPIQLKVFCTKVYRQVRLEQSECTYVRTSSRNVGVAVPM